MRLILDGMKSHLVLRDIANNEKLWNEWPLRTMYENSPHRDVDDIWLRFRDPFELSTLTPEEFCNTRYTPMWYPCMDRMQNTKKIIERIFTLVDGEELGGCLITRIPPGKQVFPHRDGGYNCEHYLSKYLLLIQSHPDQYFEIGGKKVTGEKGDLFIFDNRTTHSVVNNSDVDRISLIMSIKQKGQEVRA